MKELKCTEEIQSLLEEAPTARRALVENYKNLCDVAKYCESNYQQGGDDTKKALEETKAFTTQSLASVAYQISTLATNVLKLLDAQSAQLGHIESNINLIALTVDMHREKVARREIGAFTVSKRYTGSGKVIPPPSSVEPKPKYSRTPITYAHLDTLGHGMKDSAKPQERKATINRKHGGTLSRNSRPAECPVAPTMSRGSPVTSPPDKSITSSFGKAVPPPVAPDWPVSPVSDVFGALLEDAPAPPPALPPPAPDSQTEAVRQTDVVTQPASEIAVVAPPPPPPPPPAPPACYPGDTLPPPPADPVVKGDPEPLETVPEESGLPPPECDDLLLPAPPPPPGLEVIIPPPPSYPPPLAPPTSLSPVCRIPARLQHLDLEIPAPPLPPVDCMDGFEEIPPLPPPVDYDAPAPAEYLQKVEALYSYEASKAGGLSFQAGDVIYLTARSEDGWCEGVLNGVEGFFPGNYVQ